MAIFKFTRNILLGKKIDVFNYGNHFRDFTHVSDIKDAIIKIVKKGDKKTNLHNSYSDDPHPDGDNPETGARHSLRLSIFFKKKLALWDSNETYRDFIQYF